MSRRLGDHEFGASLAHDIKFNASLLVEIPIRLEGMFFYSVSLTLFRSNKV